MTTLHIIQGIAIGVFSPHWQGCSVCVGGLWGCLEMNNLPEDMQ
jgi:hypothetical protein